MPVRTPSYRLHKPSGQAVVTLSGKDHYLGPFGSPTSRATYDRLLAEWLANRRRPSTPAERVESISIGQLMDAYEEHAKRYDVKGGRPTSEPDNIRQALAPVRELYHDIDAREFGPLALRAARQAMIERDWCRTFINRQVNRIKRMFAWAAEEELVPIGTFQALATVVGLRRGRTEAREKPPVRPVPASAVEQVLPRLSPTVATMVGIDPLPHETSRTILTETGSSCPQVLAGMAVGVGDPTPVSPPPARGRDDGRG